MIQRIQTIYLLIASILLFLILKFPFLENSENQIVFDAFNFINGEQKISVFPIAIVAILAGVLAFVAIFFFKNNVMRVIQVRLATFSMLLALGVYIAIFVYAYFLDIFKFQVQYHYSLIFPLIAAILDFLAIKQIKKDIEKIKNVDRIR